MSYSETKLKTNSLTIENLTNDAKINVHQGDYYSLSTVYLYVSVWDDPDFILRAKNAYFNNLTADNALIHNLSSDYIYATQAFISTLSTNNIYNAESINSDLINCNTLSAIDIVYSENLMVNGITSQYIDVPLVINSKPNDTQALSDNYNPSNNIKIDNADLAELENRYVEITPIIKTNYVIQNERGYTIINSSVRGIYLQDDLSIQSGGINFQYFTFTPNGPIPTINENLTIQQTGTYTNLNYPWNGSTGPFGRYDYYGFIFTGWIYPPETGIYTFTLISDNGVKLYIDNELVLDEWENKVLINGNSTPKFLLKNTLTPIRIEFFNYGGPGSLRVRWSSDINPQLTDIPTSNLYATYDSQTTNEILSSIYIDPPNQSVIESLYTHVTASEELKSKTVYLPAGLSTFYIPDDSQHMFEIGTFFELKTLLPHTSLFEGTYYNVPGTIQLLSRDINIIEDQLKTRFINYSDLTIKYRNHIKITKVGDNMWSLNKINPMPPVHIYSRELPDNAIGEDGDIWYQYYI